MVEEKSGSQVIVGLQEGTKLFSIVGSTLPKIATTIELTIGRKVDVLVSAGMNASRPAQASAAEILIK